MNRLALLAIPAIAALAAPAYAGTLVVSGTTVGGPTYNRVLAGTPPSGLSGVGTNVNYSVVAFTVTADGGYSLETSTGFDSFLTLYAGAFDPSSPLMNALAANDDGSGSFGDAFLSLNLMTGTSYFAVVTSFDNGVSGSYDLLFDGVGDIISGAGGVPEPATWGLMILGFGAVGGAMRRRKVTVAYA